MPDYDAAQRFRSRGEETRILAETMTTAEARKKLLSLVDQYEGLARRVEKRRDRFIAEEPVWLVEALPG